MPSPKLKPCPFCGGKATIGICDEEGNPRNKEYLKDPWSGVGFYIRHDWYRRGLSVDCPIAVRGDDGERIGIFHYDTPEDAVAAWNRRAGE